MAPIIAGRFDQDTEAQHAVSTLRENGFAGDEITSFHVNPPGQHGTFPLGGDRDASLRVVEAIKPIRSAGILVAVRAPEYAKRVAAVNVLRAAGARDIERAEGTWQSGEWTDFDPLTSPLLVDLPGSEDYAVRR